MLKAKIIILVLCLALALTACTGEDKVDKKKLLFIGIDGADPKIVDKLMDEGKLPNFKKLAEQGSYERLDVVLPAHL